MKKTICITVCLTIILLLACACGKNADTDNSSSTGLSEILDDTLTTLLSTTAHSEFSDTTTATSGQTQSPTSNTTTSRPSSTSTTQDKQQETTTNTSPGKVLKGSLKEIIEAIYKVKNPNLMLESNLVDLNDRDTLKYYTGLDSAAKIREACYSEPAIGSQAYSLVLVRLKNSSDAKDVANAMKNGIDTRKWICVEADDLRVAAYEDVVMLIMVSSSLSESVTAAQIVDAYQKVCGGALSVNI
ncbi:MAG TPA: DUF4358 domain-containing protein [Clostridiales bacterium]|nr:DUF4358 domain-containing protein [Clostridiales bacterium]